MKNPEEKFLKDIAHIYREAAHSDDGHRCCVAPHPDLHKKIVATLAQLRSTSDPVLRPLLTVKETKRIGLNDGLIVPGDQLPIGTPPSVVRSFAMERAPLRGNIRVIVVLVDFSDQPMAQNLQHFRDLFFSTGVIPTGSVREYYAEVTGGQVTITGDAVGPFRMPHPMTYYANNASGMGQNAPNARNMAQDAAVAANGAVNFAPYDNDGNGYVNAFVVIHSGPGSEVTGNHNQIWSHKWLLPAEMNADGTKIYAYLTVPEDCHVGVCAHELGHLLFGFPDLYDTDYSSSGAGNWCLMGGGSWNGNGDRPAHPSAWCKSNQGWVSTINQTSNATVTIEAVQSSRRVYRLWKDGGPSNEYFLMENRQQSGFDQDLPGNGLLIWHIDDSVSSNSDERHPKVALMQADGLDQLKDPNNRGDAGDPFPGTSGNATFNATSNPNSRAYGGGPTSVSVTTISNSGSSMTARLAVTGAPAQPDVGQANLGKFGQFEKGQFEKAQLEKGHLDKVAQLEKGFFEKGQPDKTAALDKRVIDDKTFATEKFQLHDKGLLGDKRVEKPNIDKAAAFEKPPFGEKLGENGGFDRPLRAAAGGDVADLSARIGRLEMALAPFIGGDLRPDVQGGGFANEPDADRSARMAEGDGLAKRQMDTKPRER